MLKLDAALLVEEYRARLAQAVATLHQYDCHPTVAVAALDEGGESRTEARCRVFLELGAQVHQQPVPPTGAARALVDQLRLWAAEPKIHATMLEPELLQAYAEQDLVLKLAPEKDIGCWHPLTGGFLSPLSSALGAILAQYQIPLRGQHVCLLGDDQSTWLAPRKVTVAALLELFAAGGAHVSLMSRPLDEAGPLLTLAQTVVLLEPWPLRSCQLAPGVCVIDLRPAELAFAARDVELIAGSFLGPEQGWMDLEHLMWMRNLVEGSRLSHLESRPKAGARRP